MRFPRLSWLILYTLAVFAWVVFFEHGPGMQAFQNGAATELTRAWTGLRDWLSGH